ncbi:hypothetical protein B0H15DRAFT_955808 [Mycena belliarum]|uniref:Uncharacterized protein n=1 Tax=Mycena belliarum TaxID=1033014 RepID=A0AAD6TVN1_9AGAR|nr:hypothetical protein B0H15DRAFT_955808 [Mycena belliae]
MCLQDGERWSRRQLTKVIIHAASKRGIHAATPTKSIPPNSWTVRPRLRRPRAQPSPPPSPALVAPPRSTNDAATPPSAIAATRGKSLGAKLSKRVAALASPPDCARPASTRALALAATAASVAYAGSATALDKLGHARRSTSRDIAPLRPGTTMAGADRQHPNSRMRYMRRGGRALVLAVAHTLRSRSTPRGRGRGAERKHASGTFRDSSLHEGASRWCIGPRSGVVQVCRTVQHHRLGRMRHEAHCSLVLDPDVKHPAVFRPWCQALKIVRILTLRLGRSERSSDAPISGGARPRSSLLAAPLALEPSFAGGLAGKLAEPPRA